MVSRMELLPGVFLTAVGTQKFRAECFSVNLLRPLCREEAAQNALLIGVLLRGTRRYPDMTAISEALEERYGTEIGSVIRKKGEVQCVGLYADLLGDRAVGEPLLRQAAEMTAEMFLDPVMENGAFRADYVAQEKENLIRAIRSRVNGKRAYTYSQLVKNMFADEPYGVDRIGEEEDVLPVTPESLTAHYRKILATSRVEICYVGAKQPEEAAEILRGAFADLPRQTQTSVGTTPGRCAETVRELSERMDVTQGKLCMGFRTGRRVTDGNWNATALFNTVFGGGVTSKLFLNVREKLSLCYYASASLDKYKGFLCVSSGIDFDRFEAAKAAITEQLEACRRGEISEQELRAAKDQLALALRTLNDSPAQIEDYYLGNAVVGREIEPDRLCESYEKLQASDLAEAAREVRLDTVYFLTGEAAQ